MKINKIRALRGPNYSHRLPVIFIEIDLEELEERPTNSVDNFRENIEKMLPSLAEHTCSPGYVGGFFERVENGTWAGHVIEHVAIALLNLVGHEVSYGKTYTKSKKGIYHIVYRYIDEKVGLRAGEIAFNLVDELFKGNLPDPNPFIKELEELARHSIFGPSTYAIVNEAIKRGIEYYRLNDYSYVQLGQGRYQRRIEATITDGTSYIAAGIAKDKSRTKEILSDNDIPVPIGYSFFDFDECLNYAKEIGYPVVIKPYAGNHGRGITTNIVDQKELKEAFEFAKKESDRLIIEKYLVGNDYRVLVIDKKFVAAALRQPAFVIGDGKSTVKELIDLTNKDPNRGEGHENFLTKIVIDEDTYFTIDKQGIKIDDIIEKGRKINLQSTANLSSGGVAIDVTDTLHPDNKKMMERIARIIDLDIMGVDIIAESLNKSIREQNAGIIEVNAGPGLRMHLKPSEGKPINVAKPIVDMLFPENSPHLIPICAITGTNGKTTTTRLISHILSIAGRVVGMTSTDGVYINNVRVQKGDYSGPMGAQTVMRDKSVTSAVLEVARGGILNRGLGFKEADVGVMLNVSSDHLGLGGVESLEELARVKGVVTESVKEGGYTVYNAEDELVMSRSHLTSGNIILFSKDKNNKYLMENLKKGNLNITIDNEFIVIQKAGGITPLANVIEIPITFEGKADFNIENVMAAVGACIGLGVKEEYIIEGLLSFSPNIGQSPGRMNFYNVGDIKILLDYGHNVAAIHATGKFCKNIMPGKVIRIVEPTGDRRDQDIYEFGKATSNYGDYFIVADTDPRGRKFGESSEIVKKALIDNGIDESKIEIINDEVNSVKRAFSLANAGDLVVLQIGDIENVTQMILDFKEEYLEKMKKNK